MPLEGGSAPEPPDPALAPTLTSLDPNTAVLGSEDFTLRCLGTNFTEESVINFAGQPEPIVFVSAEEITTIVKPSLGWGAVTVPVCVQNADEPDRQSVARLHLYRGCTGSRHRSQDGEAPAERQAG